MASGAGAGAFGHVVGKAGGCLSAQRTCTAGGCGPKQGLEHGLVKLEGTLAQKGGCGFVPWGWGPELGEILTAWKQLHALKITDAATMTGFAPRALWVRFLVF
jgi:hypothetical protein